MDLFDVVGVAGGVVGVGGGVVDADMFTGWIFCNVKKFLNAA